VVLMLVPYIDVAELTRICRHVERQQPLTLCCCGLLLDGWHAGGSAAVANGQ
jgi:hypothetical protein